LFTWLIFDDKYRYWSSSFCSNLHSPVISTLLCPNIFLSTLLLNTLSLCSSLNGTNQVPHPSDYCHYSYFIPFKRT
jgi:hypothetical protein